MHDVDVRTLNDLIRVDMDAIRAYEDAIVACEIPEIKGQLVAFQQDHRRHVVDLAAMVRNLGGEPVQRHDSEGFFIEGFTAVASSGDRAALLAMRGNEELTASRYGAAVRMQVGSPEALAVIERNYQDEARHLAWIKEAIQSRSWDEEPGQERAA